MSKLLSLCIPTYGVSEWVFPVLESIYNQNVDESLYEVVVTDNGHNESFEKDMNELVLKHTNLIYKKTNAFSFSNEIESYKATSGEFIKFVNHRTLMIDNSINTLIGFVKSNIDDKPFVYFSNGELHLKEEKKFDSFDSFVKELSYWSSWSTGMAFWKDDFNEIKDLPTEKFNELFPHTTILFSQRKKSKYIVNDSVLLEELPASVGKKGKYDLFYAFCVEYPAIILDLLRSKDISYDTYNYVLDKNLDFVAGLYFDYVYRKKECSYDISNFDNTIDIFYRKKELLKRFKKIRRKRIINKIIKR